MSSKTLLTPMDGTPKQIVLADHAGDFGPANDLRITTDATFELDVQLTLASLADGGYRQSAIFDLGTNWAEKYNVRTAFEFAATPTAAAVVALYFGGSQLVDDGLLAGLGVTDAAYAGYNSNPEEGIKQLFGPLHHICTDDPTTYIQTAKAGLWYPTERFGIIVVHNLSDAAFHSDDVECHIVLDPVVREGQ